MLFLMRKTFIAFALSLCIILFISGVAGANFVIKTEYSITNSDDKWYLESSKLRIVLPGEDKKDYSTIVGGGDGGAPSELRFSQNPVEYVTDEKRNQYATYYYPYIAAGRSRSFEVVALYEGPLDVADWLMRRSFFEYASGADRLHDIEMSMSEAENEVYLQPSAKIESDAAEIQAKAAYLVEYEAGIDLSNYNNDRAYDIVEAIFEWVTSYKLDDYENYESSKANLGALSAYNVIEEDTGEYIVCEDYATLMAALLRSLKEEGVYIPARTVAGFKIPKSAMPDTNGETISPDDMEDYRHMWVEYKVLYDTDGDGDMDGAYWLPADPTPSYSENDTYFMDPNAYYIYDQHDVILKPATLSYRGYANLTSDDFDYNYTLIYTDENSLEDVPGYEYYKEKPFYSLLFEGNPVDEITLAPDQIGLLTVNFHEKTYNAINSIRWVSEDPTHVRVDDQGFITPVEERATGTNVYAVVNGVTTDPIRVYVDSDADELSSSPLAGLVLEQTTLYPGREFELPTLKPLDAKGGEGLSLIWEVDSRDEGIVSISGNTLKALKEGYATIYARLGGSSRSFDVRVLAEARVTEVVINPLDIFLVGQPTEVEVIVYVEGNYGDKTPIANIPAELTEEGEGILEIERQEDDGSDSTFKNVFFVTPTKFGKTTLVANARNIESSLNIEPEEIEDISINLDDQQLEVGQEVAIEITTLDNRYQDVDGETILPTVPLEWEYDDEVISVEGDGNNFKVVAVQGPGTTVLQARAGNTRSNPVEVVVEAPELTNLELELGDELIKEGGSTTLELIAEDENGEEYDLSGRNVTVYPEYEGIVEIVPTEDNSSFKISALKEGSTRIIAEVAGLDANTLIEVYKPKPVNLTMNVPTNRLVVGEMLEIAVEATDQDGDVFDLSGSTIDIQLSREDIVEIRNEGYQQIFLEASKNKIGIVRLTAEVQGVLSNSETISIIPASAVLEVDDSQIDLGETTDLRVRALDQDGDTISLSALGSGVEWDIYDPDVLEKGEETVSSDEYELEVEGIGVGKTFVRASILGINTQREEIEVRPLLKYNINKYSIDFDMSTIRMNVGDWIRIAPYDDSGDSVAGEVYSDNEDVVEVTDYGHGAKLEAVGSGTAEVFFVTDYEDYVNSPEEDEIVSDILTVIVGEPGEKISVGELVEDIREKSTLKSIPAVPGEISFADVKEHWAKEDIALATAMQIVSGYEGGTFKPDKTVTRAEFAVMFTRALGLEVEDDSSSFVDMQNHWARNSVETLYRLGLISGYEDGTFKPGKNITRAEMAAIIAKSLASQSSAKDQFTDLENMSWAEPYINKVAGLGLVKGVSEGKFAPEASATRAQAVTIIMRLLRGMQ